MSINNEPIEVTSEESGQRLDKFISSHTENLSFVKIKKLLRTGQIRIDGKRSLGKKRIETGNSIRITYVFRNLQKAKFLTYKGLNDDLKYFVDNSILYKDKEIIALVEKKSLKKSKATSNKLR